MMGPLTSYASIVITYPEILEWLPLVSPPRTQERPNGERESGRRACSWSMGGRIELVACHYWVEGGWRQGAGGSPAIDVSCRGCGRAEPQPRPHAGADPCGGARLCRRGHRARAAGAGEGPGLCDGACARCGREGRRPVLSP